MTSGREDTWDSSKEITRENLREARDQIMRDRQENGYGNGYDYPPEPTIDELFDKAQQTKDGDYCPR
jgi:hypothetical protein